MKEEEKRKKETESLTRLNKERRKSESELTASVLLDREREALYDMLTTASVSNWFTATQKVEIDDWLRKVKDIKSVRCQDTVCHGCTNKGHPGHSLSVLDSNENKK